MAILRYDSVSALISAVTCDGTRPLSSYGSGGSWDGGVPPAQACEFAKYGDPSIVAKFEGVVTDVQAAVQANPRFDFISDVLGARVNVPAFLAGTPLNMRKRVRRPVESRHVAVYVSNTSAAGVSAETLLNRGAAIVGFISALQAAGIAMDLWIVSDMQGHSEGRTSTSYADDMAHDLTMDGDCIQLIRIESAPLDLSSAGFALAHPAFARHICYRNAERYGSQGSWSKTYRMNGGYEGDMERYSAAMRAKLNLGDTDVFIPPTSYADTLVRDPQAWIQARMSQALAV